MENTKLAKYGFVEKESSEARDAFYQGISYLEKGDYSRAEQSFQDWEMESQKETPNFYKKQIIEGFLDKVKHGDDFSSYWNDSIWDAESFLIFNEVDNKDLYKLQVRNLKEKIVERHLKKTEIALMQDDYLDADFSLNVAQDVTKEFTHNKVDSYHTNFAEKYNNKAKALESAVEDAKIRFEEDIFS